MIWVLILLALVIFLIAIRKHPVIARSNWHHHFDGLKFSSQEFYLRAEIAIKDKEIPGVSFSRVTYSQGGIFSAKREYLRVSRNEYVFDICAAPFGTDFFVSWWLGEKDDDFISKIPVLNTILGKNPKMKSYYQLDTEAMFRGSVHTGVLEAIDQLTDAKGIRLLSELERKPEVNVK